jgi:hypothetical protein
MSNSIQSLQTANAQAQTEQTVQPPKKLQSASAPQDTVTISKASQQAHAGNTNAAVGGDKDHDGDSA